MKQRNTYHHQGESAAVSLKDRVGGGLIVLLLSFFLLTACDSVDEKDRLVYVAPSEVSRSILIEDFTGQRCVNCPDATDEIERLKETYGEDAIIAVGIHSGPFGVKSMPNPNYQALATDLGDEYYAHWGIEAQPGVIINRSSGPVYDTKQYASFVNTLIKQTTPLTISIDMGDVATGSDISFKVKAGASEPVKGKLQVWVVEDSISSIQLMPDGSGNMAYMHNHVFRCSVTQDPYGDDVQVGTNAEFSRDFHVAYDDKWVLNHLSIVAFVYNEKGVVQVVRQEVD